MTTFADSILFINNGITQQSHSGDTIQISRNITIASPSSFNVGVAINFSATNSTPTISQAQSTSGAGTALSITAQSSKTGSSAAGGNLVFSSGSGDGSGYGGNIILGLPLAGTSSNANNYVSLQYDGYDLIHMGYGLGGSTSQAVFYLNYTGSSGMTFQANATSSQFLHFISGSSGTILLDTPKVECRGSSGVDYIDIYPQAAANIQFNLNATGANITHANTSTGNGATMTIQAQNAIGATSTGGNLVLSPGTGTSKGGLVSLVGGQSVTTTTITNSNYTVDTNSTTADFVVLINQSSGSGITVTLPTPTSGRVLFIKDVSGNASTKNITINHSSTEKIDGANSYILAVNYGSVMLTSDGSNWYVL